MKKIIPNVLIFNTQQKFRWSPQLNPASATTGEFTIDYNRWVYNRCRKTELESRNWRSSKWIPIEKGSAWWSNGQLCRRQGIVFIKIIFKIPCVSTMRFWGTKASQINIPSLFVNYSCPFAILYLLRQCNGVKAKVEMQRLTTPLNYK